MAPIDSRSNDKSTSTPLEAPVSQESEIEALRTLLPQGAELLHSVLDKSPNGAIVCSPDGTIVQFNPAARRIWGGRAATDGLEDWSAFRAYHPDGTPYESGDWTLARCLEQRRAFEPREIEIERFDGQRATILCSAVPILDAQNNIRGAVALFNDITHLAEQAAEHRRTRFIAEASALLNSTLDLDVTLDRVAQAAIPVFADWCAVELLDGSEDAELVALAHSDSELADDLIELRRAYRSGPPHEGGVSEVLRTGQPQLYPEVTDEMIDNADRPSEYLDVVRQLGVTSAMIVPLKTRSQIIGAITFASASPDRRFDSKDLQLAGELARHAALAVDNSKLFADVERARRVAEHRARQQQAVADLGQQALRVELDALFESALEQTRELLGAQTAKVVELRQTDSAITLRAGVGWENAEVGQTLTHTGAKTALGHALRCKEVTVVEDFTDSRFEPTDLLVDHGLKSAIYAPIPGKDLPFGLLAVHSRTPTLFSNDDADFIRSVAHVLSGAVERKRAEEQRERTVQRLVEVMEHREQVLSVVSHDMRTPATSVKMNLELIRQRLEREGGALPEVLEKLETAEENIDRMVTLMTDLLASMRDEIKEIILSVEPCDFAELVRSVASAHQGALRASGSELVLEIPDSLEGRCDWIRFEQILSNLISNAIRYGEGEPVEVRLRGDDETIELSVIDRGIGIAEEDRARIFERFESAADEPDPDSFGLGLWIVRRIVDAMGGEIEVDSTLGVGSTFRVRLPRWSH